MQKIILYYKFTRVKDPEAVRLWQTALAGSLNLTGRIIISPHGINGTLGGDIKDLKSYTKTTKTFSSFSDISFKWSEGTKKDFPRLSVKVRQEIVTFNAADKLKVSEKGLVGGGKHLKPEQVHELVEKRGSEVVFFDGRNDFEAAVGRFKNAVVPKVSHSRDFKQELSDPKYDAIKDRPVVTYCTGGIRCEVLTVLMKENGFKEVYQIDGGIVKYGEKYADDGLWEGSLYVFDKRKGTKFSDKAKDIGTCCECKVKTSNYENCANVSCNRQVLICISCKQKGQKFCEACAVKSAV